MNHVFLSGVAESTPVLVSRDEQTPHAVMALTVSHRTAAGVEKKEQYPISAWHSAALRMTELIRPGARVSIKGYLSQRQTGEGIFLEVTAEEFLVSSPPSIVRPLRRSTPVQPTAPERPAVIIADRQKEP
ncbi:MAG: single-stranded DNA-binding protein [Clostridiales bacterium]|nr:single-stranded DNA-binding protein [Clostridiales bacterium]